MCCAAFTRSESLTRLGASTAHISAMGAGVMRPGLRMVKRHLPPGNLDVTRIRPAWGWRDHVGCGRGALGGPRRSKDSQSLTATLFHSAEDYIASQEAHRRLDLCSIWNSELMCFG
jgi:hypothetical protein